jgi:hypothetical protein
LENTVNRQPAKFLTKNGQGQSLGRGDNFFRRLLGAALGAMRAIGFAVGAASHFAGGLVGGAGFAAAGFVAGFAAGGEQRRSANNQSEVFHVFILVGDLG